MASTYWKVRRYVIDYTKKLAKERYDIDVKVRFKSLNHPVFCFFIGCCAAQAQSVSSPLLMKHGIDIALEGTITYDPIVLSVLIPYPLLVEDTIQHEVTHLGCPSDGHGDKFKHELAKYWKYESSEQAGKEVYGIDIQSSRFWLTSKRYNPTLIERFIQKLGVA